MKNDTKLKSTLIYGGNRTYFFDVKSNQNDEKYLVITENKPNVENSQIVITEENLAYFLKGLQRILPEFGIETILANKQTDSFRTWTYEEEEQLEQLHREGKSVEEMSHILHRSEGTIYARLEKLKILV
jgi:FAD/FMN-containing dehydrogenase